MHGEAAPALENPFRQMSLSENGGARRQNFPGGGDQAAMGAGRGGGSRAGSSRGTSPPFREFTIPPTPYGAPSTAMSHEYPATPNFSEVTGTSAMDPELLERLDRLEMALVEERKARVLVEQRLKKIKEEEVDSTPKAATALTAKGEAGKAGGAQQGTRGTQRQTKANVVKGASAAATTTAARRKATTFQRKPLASASAKTVLKPT